jgi:hypothetical protein
LFDRSSSTSAVQIRLSASVRTAFASLGAQSPWAIASLSAFQARTMSRATGGAASQKARRPLAWGAAALPNQVATRTIGSCISVACSTGEVRTDLPQSLLIDSTMSLLESLDRWVVSHWSELAADEKEDMPRKHIMLFRRLLSAEAARAGSDNRP